jgi:hypothetical protein
MSPRRVIVDDVTAGRARPTTKKALMWWLERITAQIESEKPAREAAARELRDLIQTYRGNPKAPFRPSPSSLQTFCRLMLTDLESLHLQDLPPFVQECLCALAKSYLAQTRSRQEAIGRLVHLAIQDGASPAQVYEAAEEVFHVDADTIKTYLKRYKKVLRREKEG